MIAPKAAAAYDEDVAACRPLEAIAFEHLTLGKDQDT
jgi:hypothetical protein